MAAGMLGGAAALLVAAGALKLVDPARTVGALAALRWPSSPWLVRLGAAAELALGAATLVVGGQALAMLVAASYLGFAVFVMAALGAKTPIGTCGCFGQADIPPRPVHVVVNGLLAAGSVLAAATDVPALLDASWLSWLTAAVIAATAWAVIRSGAAQLDITS